MDKKLIAFVGGGLVLGGGFFAWYFLFGNDMVQREGARKQIVPWEAQWQKARACLLGDAPKEADPADTLAIRALDEIEIHCSLADLGRPEGQGSGIDEIEDAWGKIETAWHALAKAVPDPVAMGPQIRALDDADAQLRRGAKMDALPAPKPTRVVTDLVLGAPVASGGADVSLESPTRGHVLYGGNGLGIIAVRGPGPPTITKDIAGVVRGWPDASWGAAFTTTGLDSTVAVGPMAPDGNLGAGAAIAIRGNVDGVMAAIGGGDKRVLVIRPPAPDTDDFAAPLAIVRTTDGGAHWSKPEKVAGDWELGLWDSGTNQPVMLGHKDADTPAFLFFDATTGAATAVAAGGSPDPTRACFAGALWYSVSEDEGSIFRVADGQAASAPPSLGDRGELLACTKDAIAVRVGEKIHRCSATACDDGLDVPNHIGFGDVFDGSGVVFAAQSARVVGIWRSGLAPVYDRVPAGAHLIGVAIFDKTPTLAFQTAAGLQLAPMK